MRTFITALMLAVLAGCAKEGSPPGGPVDRTAPRVVSTRPEPGSTGRADPGEIVIDFSERVNRRAAEGALAVVPVPDGELRIRWRGTRMLVTLPGTPLPDRTYIISIGAAVTDLRGNAMEASYLFAFATGDSLDRNTVTGTVRGTDLKGTASVVWAVSPGDMDGLLPVGTPAYVTQSGADGRFAFRYMGAGTYRLLAFDDRNGNGVPDIGREALGGTDRDVSAHPPGGGVHDAEIVLVASDTIPPVPVRAVLAGNRVVEVTCDRPVALVPRAVMVQVTDSLGTFRTEGTSFIMGRPDANSFTAITGAAVSAEFCSVHVQGIPAASGPDGTNNYLLAAVRADPDTLCPVLQGTTPARGSRQAHPDGYFEFRFNVLMDTVTVPDAGIEDTAGTAVPCSVYWGGYDRLHCLPLRPLAGRTVYSATVDMNTCTALNGRTGADTVLSRQFTTVSTDTLGGMSGTVLTASGTAYAGVTVVARRAGPGIGAGRRSVTGDDGRFEFLRLLPGSYSLYAFDDTDADGLHSPARLRPFRRMEPLAVPDVPVTVRPLWEVEDIRIIFPGLPEGGGDEHPVR